MGRRTLGNQSYSPTYDGQFPLLTAAFSIFATTSIHYHESRNRPCDLGGIRQLLVSNQTVFAISWRLFHDSMSSPFGPLCLFGVCALSGPALTHCKFPVVSFLL